MSFTALHRAAGVGPGPLTEDVLDAAVAAGAPEAADLDWKAELPPAKGLSQTDFPKDVAAMANSGGGVIAFGVQETQKAATGRSDAGDCDEGYERALRAAAMSAISPPVFGLNVHRFGTVGRRAVVVEVLASVDGPHLIYKNHYFGAPVRNDADTVWMKERQIEATYRARFEERRHAVGALEALAVEALAGRDTAARAWIVAVARPRIPRVGDRLTRGVAREVFTRTEGLALTYAGRGGIHPVQGADLRNPRPGLRRWIAASTAAETSRWKEAWLTLHDDGAVTLAAAVGGRRRGSDEYFGGGQVESAAIECAIADFMALIRQAAEETGNDEYDVRVGIAWSGDQPLTILERDRWGDFSEGTSIPLHHYTPVEMTVNAAEASLDFYWHVHDLAQDCVNQGGVAEVSMIHPPERDG